jgi:hypothetical protein
MGYDADTFSRFFNEAKRLHPTYSLEQLQEWAIYSATHHWNRLHPTAPAKPSRWEKVTAHASKIPWAKVAIILYRLAILVLLCRLILK